MNIYCACICKGKINKSIIETKSILNIFLIFLLLCLFFCFSLSVEVNEGSSSASLKRYQSHPFYTTVDGKRPQYTLQELSNAKFKRSLAHLIPRLRD